MIFSGYWRDTMRPQIFRPGETVPTSGVYRVEHASHRLMHEATLIGHSAFPQCRHCGSAVRFFLMRAVEGRRILPFRSTAILEEFKARKPFTIPAKRF